MTREVLRPCWCIGITLLVVLLLCPWLTDTVRCGGIVTAVLLLLAAVVIRPLRRIRAIVLVLIACCAALLAFEVSYHTRIAPVEAGYGKPVSVQARVVDVADTIVLEVVSGDLPRGTSFHLFVNGDVELSRYDVITDTFTLSPYPSDTAVAAFMRRASGVWVYAKPTDDKSFPQEQTQGDAPWTDVFYRAKTALMNTISRRLSGEAGAVVHGICFGEDGGLSAQATSAFRDCGVSHLFAVSGLHLTVLLYGLLAVLKRLRLPRVWRAVIGAVLALLFVALIGFTPSVVRAGVLCTVVMLGTCLRRRADSLNSLGLALILLLIADPTAAYDAGLLLSFAATLGLLFWSKPLTMLLLGKRELKRLVKIRKDIAATVAVSLAATVATLPITVLYFGRVSLMSVPSNLLTTVAAEGVLISGWLAALLSVLHLTLIAEPFLWIAGVLARYLLMISQKISSFSLSTVAIRADYLVLWLIGTYLVLLIGRRVLSRHGCQLLAGLCVLTLCLSMLVSRGVRYDHLRVRVVTNRELAVSLQYRGNCVLVIAPESHDTLYQARNMLQNRGVTLLDAVFVVGGSEPTVSYLPLELSTYLSDDTLFFYRRMPENAPSGAQLLNQARVTLGNEITAGLQDGQLLLQWNGQRLLFVPWSIPEPTAQADAVFIAGQPIGWVWTNEGFGALDSAQPSLTWANGEWLRSG